jgi:8-oxo-dGTP pyrophosphatase MutT (NUDIX family)
VTTPAFRQLIPRPSTVSGPTYPGWLAELGPGWENSFESDVFRSRLPGTFVEGTSPVPITAAVLICCFDFDGEVGILLTRRAATLRTEPLMISFPGGWVEPGETPVQAALREAEEEIGLPASLVEVVGSLSIADRRRANEAVLPVVAWIKEPFIPTPNPEEVDEVLQVPLSTLLEEGAAWSEEWGIAGEARTLRFFAHADVLGLDLVWGLTARIIWELIERTCLANR